MLTHILRYFLSLFHRWFWGTCALFTALIFVFEFVEFQRKTAFSHQISLLTKFSLLLLKTPFMVEQLLPLIVFVATLGLFWRLASGNEFLILRTFGQSPWRMSRPFMLAAIVFSLFNLTAIQPLSVLMFKKFQVGENKHFYQKNTESFHFLNSGLWINQNTKDRRLIYHIRSIDMNRSILHQVSLYVTDHNNQFVERFMADRAILRTGSPKSGIQMQGVWALTPDQPPRFSATLEPPYRLSLTDLAERTPNPQSVSFWALPGLIQVMDQAGLSAYKYTMEWHRLLAVSVWIVAMVLLAFACGLRSQDRSLRQHGGAATLLVSGILGALALFLIRDMTHALGAARYLPLLFAVWTPPILTTMVALLLLLHWEEGKKS